MKKVHYIIIVLALLFLSCGNGKGGKNYEPLDGGHGIGIDTATVHEIERNEDSIKTKEPVAEKPKSNGSGAYSSTHSSGRHYDNMRGFDPASEDDMDDNGMSRYMEANDDEGWD